MNQGTNATGGVKIIARASLGVYLMVCLMKGFGGRRDHCIFSVSPVAHDRNVSLSLSLRDGSILFQILCQGNDGGDDRLENGTRRTFEIGATGSTSMSMSASKTEDRVTGEGRKHPYWHIPYLVVLLVGYSRILLRGRWGGVWYDRV